MSKHWRMDAYYYGFDRTGVDAIDLILSAVACAGKAFHHTEEWGDEAYEREYLRGKSPVAWIQNAANDAAALMKSSEGQSQWRGIESAPKDGTEILAVSMTGNTGVMLCRWGALDDFITTDEAEDYIKQGMSQSDLEVPDWFFADFAHGDRLSPDVYPTHWLPLPSPPSEGGT